MIKIEHEMSKSNWLSVVHALDHYMVENMDYIPLEEMMVFAEAIEEALGMEPGEAVLHDM